MRAAWQRARVLPATGRVRGRNPDPGPLHAVLARAQSRGEVREDLPPEQLAELLRGGLVAALAHALSGSASGGTPTAALEDRLARAADVLLDAFRKRNERVAAPTPSSSRRPARSR